MLMARKLCSWRNLFAILAIWTLPISSFAQQIITGKVTDPKGNALTGVNVVVKNTLNGVITNQDGQYSIAVNAQKRRLFFHLSGLLRRRLT